MTHTSSIPPLSLSSSVTVLRSQRQRLCLDFRGLGDLDWNAALAAAEQTLDAGEVVFLGGLAGVFVVLVLGQLLKAKAGVLEILFHLLSPVALLGDTIAQEADTAVQAVGVHGCRARG
jgi:hypothetical protein